MGEIVFMNQLPMDELNEMVFSRELLQPDEKPLACWDAGQFIHNLKAGYLISTHSLIRWTKKEVRRFDFDKMTDVCNVSALDILAYDIMPSSGSEKQTCQIRFLYGDESVNCPIPAHPILIRMLMERIPKEAISYHRTLDGMSIAKCSTCLTSMEGVWFPLSSAPVTTAPFVFGIDSLAKFGCQNMLFEHLPNCHAFICLKCLLTLIQSEKPICPSCHKKLTLAERTLIAGHFPAEIKTRMSSRSVVTKFGTPASWSFFGFERPWQTSLPLSLLDKLQIPRDGCSLCMKGNATSSFAYASPDFLKGKCQWPLCPECLELISDSRFKRVTQFQKSDFLEPVEITSPPVFAFQQDFDLNFSFANPNYGRLFDKGNKGLNARRLFGQ